ncbi:MAG: hypothetical protein ACOYOK_08145 [Pseudobdellovibrionaceae bacterium]
MNMPSYISQLKSKLKSTLPTFKLQDFFDLVEEVSPKRSNNAASYLMSLVGSVQEGIPFRYIKVNDTQVLALIPFWRRNLNAQNHIDESVVTAVAVNMVRTLWSRHTLSGRFENDLSKMQLEIRSPLDAEVHLKLEIDETYRESILSLLRQNSQATSQHAISIFNSHEQIIGELLLDFQWRWVASLDSSTTKT